MTRPLLLGAALLGAATAAPAQQPRAHMEACTEWDYVAGQLGTLNTCDRPVSILFMILDDQRVVQRNVPPGARFNSGATEADVKRGWIFTACPIGHAPSVLFAAKNAAAILDSLYNCLPAHPDA